MPIPITIPRLGWNMDEGSFAGWLKANGDQIRPGDRIFSLESEKATEEIETLDSGILHISPDGPKVGDKLEVGAVIGYLLQPGEVPPTLVEPKTTVANRQPAAESRTPLGERQLAKPDRRSPIAASPRARRTAAELGVDWTKLQGSGRTGRIRERDLRAASTAPPVSLFRRTIAERMLASVRSTAPVTLTTAADAVELVKLRERYKITSNPVPSFTDLFIKLVANALKKHPCLNSRWGDDRIIEETNINIGFAVDTEAGLMVPVIRDVPSVELVEIARRTQELIERARQGKLKPDELRGGTFTITNLGAFGIDAFTPIINYPECAILGIGRIGKKPAVVGDEIAIREMVTLSLTFDHRIVDGAPAARFLQTLVGLIEHPASSLT